MAGGITITSWNAGALLATVADGLERGMNLAMATLAADAARLAGVAGGGKPSVPGDPPAMQSGTLHANVDFDVQSQSNGVHGFFGVRGDVPYALRMELGFVGVDSLGRHYNQAPRPFLRPALYDNSAQVVSIVASEARI